MSEDGAIITSLRTGKDFLKLRQPRGRWSGRYGLNRNPGAVMVPWL